MHLAMKQHLTDILCWPLSPLHVLLHTFLRARARQDLTMAICDWLSNSGMDVDP